MTRLYNQFKQYLMIVLMVFFLSALIASIPAAKFQRAISAPILDLARNMKRVSGEAVKFTPDGGHVELSAHVISDFSTLPVVLDSPGKDTWIGICVRDTGIGLKKEDLNRIFNPFEQVESARNRKFQGTGLGLALVSNLVSLHGGKVWAESDGENRGTRVSFAIPAGFEPDRVDREAGSPAAAGNNE
jgi:signal transduction histidine kinase